MAFSSGSSFVCSHCGKRVWGNSFNYNGKLVCLKCYETLNKNTVDTKDAARNELYDYIERIFHHECLPEVSSSIEKWIKRGKTYKGISYTLYYFYELMGNKAESMMLVNWVIETQYENAKQYLIDSNELKVRNEQVQISVPPNVVKINPQSKKKIKKNITYKMEDL